MSAFSLSLPLPPLPFHYAYLDFDHSNLKSKRSLAALFVNETNSRYNLSSKDIRQLGGSELNRLEEFYATDHDFGNGRGEISTDTPTHNTRIIVKLYSEQCPITVENFLRLCIGNEGSGESGKKQEYKNCNVHRVVKRGFVQTGDFVFGNGSGGESAYGKKFKDEKNGLAMKHSRRGILSMGNSGKNSNTSQFFITFNKLPSLDGKHVVIGEVVSGDEVLTDIEAFASTSEVPTAPITLTNTGIYIPSIPGAGYWLNIPDETFNGFTPVFNVFPRILIVCTSIEVYEKFKQSCDRAVTCGVSRVIAKDADDQDAIISINETCRDNGVDFVIIASALRDIESKLECKHLLVCKPMNVGSIFESGGAFFKGEGRDEWALCRKK